MAGPFDAMLRLIDNYDMIPEGGTVLCALSGGADSVCLLHRLRCLQYMRRFTLAAAHFNHRLRGEESDRDEAFVRKFVAEHCGPRTVSDKNGEHQLPAVSLYVGSGDVAGEARRRKAGLEETAREMRYGFLRKTAAQLGGALIATAHTADDNAETILLHLARGSGLRGLTGIRPVGDGVIRPMLTTTRTQVEEHLRLYGLPHVEDSSNTDESFSRNRPRRRVLPELEALYPGVAARTADTAALLRLDEDYLTAQAENAVAGIFPENGTIRLSAKTVGDLPDALAPRAARLLIARLREGDTDLAAPHLLGVVALCRGTDPSAQISLPDGLTARREYGDLVISSGEDVPKSPAPVPVALNGQTVYGDTGWSISCRPAVCPEENSKNPDTFYLSCDRISGTLFLRPRQTGDSLKLPGRSTRTLKKLFIDRKVPRLSRSLLPVLADKNGIAAVASFGPDESYLAAPGEGAWEITFHFGVK